jgi:hypothetical protein
MCPHGGWPLDGALAGLEQTTRTAASTLPPMAARRLIMVLLVLLIVSTFAATLVPPPDRDTDETTTPATSIPSEDRGRLVHATVSADAKRPVRVRLELGNELALRVTASRFHEVEIPTLGEFDEVDQFAPVVFDLLPDGAGRYPVRVVETGDVIARIVVVSGSGRRA